MEQWIFLRQKSFTPFKNKLTTRNVTRYANNMFFQFHYNTFFVNTKEVFLLLSIDLLQELALTTQFPLRLYWVSVSVASFTDVFGCEGDSRWYLCLLACAVAFLKQTLWSKQLLCAAWVVFDAFTQSCKTNKTNHKGILLNLPTINIIFNSENSFSATKNIAKALWTQLMPRNSQGSRHWFNATWRDKQKTEKTRPLVGITMTSSSNQSLLTQSSSAPYWTQHSLQACPHYHSSLNSVSQYLKIEDNIDQFLFWLSFLPPC